MAVHETEPSRGTPWGAIVALLTACAATLLGVVRGLEPWLILYRAALAALVAGLVVSIASAVVTRISNNAMR